MTPGDRSRWVCAIGLSAAVALAARPDTTRAQDEPASETEADAIGFGDDSAPAPQPTASGEDAVGFGEDAVGFGPATDVSAPEAAPLADETPSPLQLKATLRMQGAIRTETARPSRLAKLRQVLDASLEYKAQPWAAARLRALASLHTEADFAYLSDLDAYDSATVESEAWQIRPGETYLALSVDVFELSAGYQIANLGQGELVSVLDVVNPRDLREPMPTELSVTHIPVLMSRAGLTFESVRLEVWVVHESQFGYFPPPLGELSPVRGLLLEQAAFAASLAGRTLRNQHLPERDVTNLDAMQPYGRIALNVGALDLSLLGGSPLDAWGVPSLPQAAEFANLVIDMPVVHPRYAMIGHAGSYTFGPFLLRWELAFNIDRPLAMRATDSALLRLSAARRNQLQGMLGMTYVPSTLTSAALEVTQTHVFDDPSDLPAWRLRTLFPLEAPQLALRFNQRFLRERAGFALVALLIGVSPVNAGAARAEVSYMLSDQLEVTAGYVLYVPTRHFGFLYGLDRADRVFVNVRWEIAD